MGKNGHAKATEHGWGEKGGVRAINITTAFLGPFIFLEWLNPRPRERLFFALLFLFPPISSSKLFFAPFRSGLFFERGDFLPFPFVSSEAGRSSGALIADQRIIVGLWRIFWSFPITSDISVILRAMGDRMLKTFFFTRLARRLFYSSETRVCPNPEVLYVRKTEEDII